jgi:hypothetical protein
MSWDLFAMDIPVSVNVIGDVPSGWVPNPIVSHQELLNVILDIAPFANASDRYWVRIDAPGAEMEIHIGKKEPLTGFVFHVRGGDPAVGLIAAILGRLNLRAFDPGSVTGIFDPATAGDSLARWQQFRDQVIAQRSES